jgi:hypothetical protein
MPVVPTVMMNEPAHEQPPADVLQQADLLAVQFQGDNVPEVAVQEVNVEPDVAANDEVVVAANLNIAAPQVVAPVVEDAANTIFAAPQSVSVAPGVAVQESHDAVDVLMEFQLEDDMLIAQDSEQENTERALTLFVPPISQQFQEIISTLDAIQVNAASSRLAAVQFQRQSMKRSWEIAFSDKVNAAAVLSEIKPVVLQLDRKVVSLSTIKVVDSLEPPPVPEFSTPEVPADVEFTALLMPVHEVQSKTVKKSKAIKSKETPLVDVGLRRHTRGSAAREGYRVPPITDIAPKPRKKARRAVPATRGDQANKEKTEEKPSVTPQIPLKTLQHIGDLLEIEPDLITVDKLTAVSGEEQSTSG